MIRAITLAAVVSLTWHVTVLSALKVATETLTRHSANATAAMVSIVGFFWFGAHAVLVTRVGERALRGRRGPAIAITTVITLLEVLAALAWVVARMIAQGSR